MELYLLSEWKAHKFTVIVIIFKKMLNFAPGLI